MTLRFLIFLVCLEVSGSRIGFSQNMSDSSNKKVAEKERSKQYITLGRHYLESGKYSLALLNLDLALLADTTSWMAFRFKGETELRLTHYDSAIASYSQAIRLNPADTFSFKGRAEAFRYEERGKEAIADYSVALSFDPQDSRMRF